MHIYIHQIQRPHVGVPNSTGHTLGVHNQRTYVKERHMQNNQSIIHIYTKLNSGFDQKKKGLFGYQKQNVPIKSEAVDLQDSVIESLAYTTIRIIIVRTTETNIVELKLIPRTCQTNSTILQIAPPPIRHKFTFEKPSIGP